MSDIDKRCCGSGVCIINEAGECWCGQRWDGSKMSFVPLDSGSASEAKSNSSNAAPSDNQSHSRLNKQS
jgi:hypothetical protein